MLTAHDFLDTAWVEPPQWATVLLGAGTAALLGVFQTIQTTFPLCRVS